MPRHAAGEQDQTGPEQNRKQRPLRPFKTDFRYDPDPQIGTFSDAPIGRIGVCRREAGAVDVHEQDAKQSGPAKEIQRLDLLCGWCNGAGGDFRGGGARSWSAVRVGVLGTGADAPVPKRADQDDGYDGEYGEAVGGL